MSTTAVPEVPLAHVEDAQHVWSLRDDEFEDGGHVRCFECIGCGAVRFE